MVAIAWCATGQRSGVGQRELLTKQVLEQIYLEAEIMFARLMKLVLAIIAIAALSARGTTAIAQATTDPAASAARVDVPPGPPQPVEPGYLGLVTDDRQEAGKGVRVREAVAGGPAAKGGLASGDLITSIDGKPVHGNTDMISTIGSLPPGTQVAFEIDRNGQKQQINVTLGKRPAAGERRFEQFGPVTEQLPPPGGTDVRPPLAPTTPAEPASGAASPSPIAPSAGGPRPVPRAGTAESAQYPRNDSAVRSGGGLLSLMPGRALLGVRTQAITPETERRLKLSTTSGALVVARTPGSPAERAGIPLDAVIIAVNGSPVDSPLDLARVVGRAKSGSELEIAYIADGATKQVKVTLDEAPSAFAARPSTPLPIAPTPGPDIAPPTNPPPSSDNQIEIEALKRRVQDLEARVHELEQAAKK
jgi:membrane-associated protease RseP (regulator of RpoE activity)